MIHNRVVVYALLLRHARRARRCTSGSSTSPIVGRWKQLVQSCNLARSQVPYEDGVLDADEVGITCDRVPILCMRNTSPRLEVGMCANGWAAIRLLLVGRGLLVAAFCLGGVTIKGNLRWAASRGVGVASLSAWPSEWPSYVGVEVPAMCLACSNLGGQTSPSSPSASAPMTMNWPIYGGVPCTGDNEGESVAH